MHKLLSHARITWFGLQTCGKVVHCVTRDLWVSCGNSIERCGNLQLVMVLMESYTFLAWIHFEPHFLVFMDFVFQFIDYY